MIRIILAVSLLVNALFGTSERAETNTWNAENCSLRCDCSFAENSQDIGNRQTIFAKTMDCSRRKLKEVPKDIPADTQVLNVEENLLQDFQKLQKATSSLENLTDLLISGNKFSSFQANYTSLSINRILANDNCFKKLAPGLEDLFPNLRELYLTRNSITQLDHTICNKTLPGLKRLSLNYNKIDNLYWISGCTIFNSLVWLDLGGNKIQSQYIHNFTFSSLVYLQTLVLENMELVEIEMSAFYGIEKLEALDLSDNLLSSVPNEAIQSLTHLKSLNFNGNSFRQIHPHDFAGLENLQVIELTRLSLLQIVDENSFQYLPSLETVILSNNKKLAYISQEAFKFCPKLTTLDLHHTIVEILHENILTSLRSLKTLNLRENPINCNCMMRWVKPWMLHKSSTTTGIQGALVDDVICSSPPNVRGSRLADVQFREKTCPPTVQPTLPLHINLAEEETLILNCRVFGSPMPTISWNVPGEGEINCTTATDINGAKIDKYGTLTMKNPKNGYYTCNARNMRGTASREVLVRRVSTQGTTRSLVEMSTSADIHYTQSTALRQVSQSTALRQVSQELFSNPISTSRTKEMKTTIDLSTSPTILNSKKVPYVASSYTEKGKIFNHVKPSFLSVPKIEVLDVSATNALITWSSHDLVESFKNNDNKVMKISLMQNNRIIYVHEVQPFSILPSWEAEGPEYNISSLSPGETYIVCLMVQCCDPPQEKQSCNIIHTASKEVRVPSNKTAIALSVLLCTLLLAAILLLAICYGRNFHRSSQWNDELYEGLDEMSSEKEETQFSDIYQPLIKNSYQESEIAKPTDRLIDTSSSTVYM